MQQVRSVHQEWCSGSLEVDFVGLARRAAPLASGAVALLNQLFTSLSVVLAFNCGFVMIVVCSVFPRD
jgi:hypothetical protein